tara:strand:- start:16236 stop:17381 length:1146 start_codon:yes stop_codon:yes gene_type:complete
MKMNFLRQKKRRVIQNKFEKPMVVKDPFDNFYYKEVAKMTAAGGWYSNFKEKVSFLDPEARRILKTPPNYKPSPKTALEFYAEDHRQKALEIFNSCSQGEAFTTDIKMLTYDKKEFWARAVGEAIYDNNNDIIGVHGVFQDINAEKLKEISLEKSLKIIVSQNSRLLNFAHVVSHNLRSHSSNLQLTLELLNSINSEKEIKELNENLLKISHNLNETISHLNEIVTIQAKAKEEKQPVNFENTLESVKNVIHKMISETDAEIYSDFSEMPTIQYVPAYLENILLNLITNAIKYKHPDRNPVIDICTYMEHNEKFLLIKDNGRGIDLDKFGSKLFNMYQTFHHNEDARGVGLFITKNQIESLNGTISVQSKPGEGTSFTIMF